MAATVKKIRREKTPTHFKGKAYVTPAEDDLEIAVLRYASEWLSDYRLGDRRPNEIEVFLQMADEQLIVLTVYGEKTIDAVLAGDAGPLREQLLRFGLPPGALIPAADGGPLQNVRLSTARFFELKIEAYEQRRELLESGVAFRDLPFELRVRPKRRSFEYSVGEDFFVSKREAKAEAERTGLPLEVIDRRNRPAMETFLDSKLGRELRPISVTRVAPGEPVRQQADAAAREARKRKRPVRLQVEVEGKPIQIEPPTGKVGKVRRPSGIRVQVVRDKAGRFTETYDAPTRAAVFRAAKARGFSLVARELGIARGTIYGWVPDGRHSYLRLGAGR